jgi:hypothetical protein
MKKLLPVISLILVIFVGYLVVHKQQKDRVKIQDKVLISSFDKPTNKQRMPIFLRNLKIPQPIIIDLSQLKYKGLAFLYGTNFHKAIHAKEWEKYGNLSTYTLDRYGNLYLIPMPFISIKKDTFNLQTNIYKVDSKSGHINIWVHFDDIKPNASNPYGLISIDYDSDDGIIFASAIDESTYQNQNGAIYVIDIKTKNIIQKIDGFDALSIKYLKDTDGKKYLLVGSARDNGLYAFGFENGKLAKEPIKILDIKNPTQYIRKIKIIAKNMLELQTITFSYSLVSRSTGNKLDREYHIATLKDGKWEVYKKQ